MEKKIKYKHLKEMKRQVYAVLHWVLLLKMKNMITYKM